MTHFARLTLLSGTALAVLTTAALAAPAVALVGDKTLVMFRKWVRQFYLTSKDKREIA